MRKVWYLSLGLRVSANSADTTSKDESFLKYQKASLAPWISPVFLNVPFAEKDNAKGLDAQSDQSCKKWWTPASLTASLADFAPWMSAADLARFQLSPPRKSIPSAAVTHTPPASLDVKKKDRRRRRGQRLG